MKKQILEYVSYNLWANKSLAEYIKKLSETQMNQTIVSSFPSVRATLLHIAYAEYLWMQRIKEEAPSMFLNDGFAGTNREVLEQFKFTSFEFYNYLCDKDDSFFSEKRKYKTLSYGETTQTVYTMLHHCMNHSTYHRGQITMMLRQLGFDNPPHLDYMLWKMK